ncbi:hypothetical protein FOVSG1_003462 [Fusarium oxysporum f. sp. vasinfectum]
MKDNKLFFSNNTSPLTIAIILLPDLQHRTISLYARQRQQLLQLYKQQLGCVCQRIPLQDHQDTNHALTSTCILFQSLTARRVLR